MKNLTCITVLLLGWLCAGCSHTRSVRDLTVAPATILLERPEDNGSINILSCEIAFSTGQRVKLDGGESTSLTVPANSLWLEASSIDLYNHENPSPRAWLSSRLKMCLKPGDVVSLLVEPRSKGSTYIGGWTIRRTELSRPCAKRSI